MVGTVAAVDLGATSGRVIRARVGARTLELDTVTRFDNVPVRQRVEGRDELHWDIHGLFDSAIAGLQTIAHDDPDLASIGFDSWAVDYGLLRSRQLIEQPYHYRDGRTAQAIESVHTRVSPAELYRQSGLQFLPFNTLYQLTTDRDRGMLAHADRILLIPDLMAFLLTGEITSERTNASTTGLLRADGAWNSSLMERLDLPTALFAPLVQPGDEIGSPSVDHDDIFGYARPVVTAVGSHDTASAIVAVPMNPERSAYISCGTWALVGVELEHRVLTEASRAANFTNELGVDNRNRYLRNVMGLWLLSESLRHWQQDGDVPPLGTLLDTAGALPAPAALFDVDDPCFLEPGDIPSRIIRWFQDRDLPAPTTRGEIVRVIIESLAEAFAQTVRHASELSGLTIDTIHIVGGGALNSLLCQATADKTGLPVLAGPVEATAVGNTLIQARAQRFITGDLETLRALVSEQFQPLLYSPRSRD